MMFKYFLFIFALCSSIGRSPTLSNGNLDTSPLEEESNEFTERNDCGCSEVGCCSDHRTVAKRSNFAGDSCAASEYGCCPDGIEEARGESFEGCLAIPSTYSAVCGLEKDRGTCHNFTLKWFFDTEVGSCLPFWYRGCEGNENRFNTQEECEEICVQPKGRDACYLPKIEGFCEGSYPTWYYDPAEKQCGQVMNGGCSGIANKFKTEEECEELCLESNDIDPCKQAKETGLCRGNFTRWYYDKETQACEEFTYGGCKGNDNNFLTKVACNVQCLSVRDPCNQAKDTGVCQGKFTRWYYNNVTQSCEEFTYGGCKGNDNNFPTEVACHNQCPSPSVSVTLNVSVPQTKFPEGSEVSITCDVDVYYITGIRWYKDGNVIRTDNSMNISTNRLIIPNAKRRDSGTYRCEAYDWLSDSIGSGEVTIEVLVPVKVNVSVPQSKFPYGSDVSIACVVNGYPIPRILWYKDENLIQADEMVQISEENALIISSANRDDSGTYRCEATNQFSTSSGSVEIEVLVDQYLLPERCSQFCDNEKCSFNCSCVTGYLRDPRDLRRCKAAEGHASLLVGTEIGILNITFDGQEMTAIESNTYQVQALDFDIRNRMIFWCDYHGHKIYKAPIDEGNHRTVVLDSVHTYYNNLAVDWIYKHIYWTDEFKNTIELADFEGNMRKTLITGCPEWPAAIALDPLEGWMFWTDLSSQNPRIERAGMDGSHRSIIVKTELDAPRGLTLDLIGKRLYWVDYSLKTIAACNYDGSERRTILYSEDIYHSSLSITTFDDHVYWPDRNKKAIFRANKFTGKVVERVTPLSFSQVPFTVRVYHPSRQLDGKNQCQADNGHCSHLCLPAPIISSESPLRSCACPDGLKLLPDGLTCVKNGMQSCPLVIGSINCFGNATLFASLVLMVLQIRNTSIDKRRYT